MLFFSSPFHLVIIFPTPHNEPICTYHLPARVRHLCCISRCNWLADASDLGTGADDALAGSVRNERDILVFALGLLPDLDLGSSTEDADAHGRKQVVGSVGVVVDTTVEHGGSVLSNTRSDESLSTWVVLDEITDIVDDAGNSDESTTVFGLSLVVVPRDDWELLERNTPVEGGTLLIKLLLELLEAALMNLVGLELFQIVGETKLRPDPDGPLGWVVLVPGDGIAIIGWKLVVEVVVSLTKCGDGGDEVISWGVAVIEWLVTKPVGKRVDTEGSLLDDENAEDTGVDEASLPVSPPKAANQHWEDHSHEDDDLEVVAVLPYDDWVIVQVGYVGTADALWILLHQHPSEVGVDKTLADRVWVLVGIGVSVVSPMVSGPPSDGTLNGATSSGGEQDLQWKGSGVRAVSPKAMIT